MKRWPRSSRSSPDTSSTPRARNSPSTVERGRSGRRPLPSKPTFLYDDCAATGIIYHHNQKRVGVCQRALADRLLGLKSLQPNPLNSSPKGL